MSAQRNAPSHVSRSQHGHLRKTVAIQAEPTQAVWGVSPSSPNGQGMVSGLQGPTQPHSCRGQILERVLARRKYSHPANYYYKLASSRSPWCQTGRTRWMTSISCKDPSTCALSKSAGLQTYDRNPDQYGRKASQGLGLQRHRALDLIPQNVLATVHPALSSRPRMLIEPEKLGIYGYVPSHSTVSVGRSWEEPRSWPSRPDTELPFPSSTLEKLQHLPLVDANSQLVQILL